MAIMIRFLIVGAVLCGGLMADPEFNEAQAARFAKLALGCVHREYPNKIAHLLNSAAAMAVTTGIRRSTATGC